MPFEDPLPVIRHTRELVARTKTLHEKARHTVEHSKHLKERLSESRHTAQERRKGLLEK